MRALLGWVWNRFLSLTWGWKLFRARGWCCPLICEAEKTFGLKIFWLEEMAFLRDVWWGVLIFFLMWEWIKDEEFIGVSQCFETIFSSPYCLKTTIFFPFLLSFCSWGVGINSSHALFFFFFKLVGCSLHIIILFYVCTSSLWQRHHIIFFALFIFVVLYVCFWTMPFISWCSLQKRFGVALLSSIDTFFSLLSGLCNRNLPLARHIL